MGCTFQREEFCSEEAEVRQYERLIGVGRKSSKAIDLFFRKFAATSRNL